MPADGRERHAQAPSGDREAPASATAIKTRMAEAIHSLSKIWKYQLE
jgi:hypothetical protein